MIERVLVLGCGYAGSAVARLARSRRERVLVTVRSEARAESLRTEGFEVLCSAELDASIARHVDEQTQVVVCFPPDGSTDERIAGAIGAAPAITYLSSTGVYDELTGPIDDETPLPAVPSERAARLLNAEATYRRQGGTVLRCPGIYGPERGLHRRIQRGEHRIPGDGSRMLSRIHVEDLAEFALAARQVRGECFVVGDLEPAPHLEVVRFVCESYALPLPPSAPLAEVHRTLRADRRVDASRALRVLGVELRYPSYREGMAKPT